MQTHCTFDVEITLAKGIIFTKIGLANSTILRLWAAHPYPKFSREPSRGKNIHPRILHFYAHFFKDLKDLSPMLDLNGVFSDFVALCKCQTHKRFNTKIFSFQGRTLILNNSNYMNSLVDTVLSRMSAVETPVQILTANLGINVEKKMGYLMNETMDRTIMGGKMILPPLQDLNVDQSLIINSIVSLLNWINSSQALCLACL